jgi:hypothetical protein
MRGVQLDLTDEILIGLVDSAVKAGVGHSFKPKHGGETYWRVHVLAIDDKFVRLRAPNGEEMTLPRNVREIAQKTAMIQGRITDD